MCPILALWVPWQPQPHCSEALALWRGAEVQQHPQDGLSLLPTLGIAAAKSTFIVVLWLQFKRKGAKVAVVAVPAPQEVSWSPVLPRTAQVLGPKSQLESCWLSPAQRQSLEVSC